MLLILSDELIGQSVNTPGIAFWGSKLVDTTYIGAYTSITPLDSNGFELLNPVFKNSYNSGYPRGYNDGPIWKGRGLTTEIHAGATYKRGGLSVTIQPALYFSQNKAFDLGPELSSTKSTYNYQYANGIDWVMRYGDKAFTDINLGQSEIRYTIRHFSVSASTQNITFGPSVFNPIVLSQQAAGIPHLEIGTTPIAISVKDKRIIAVTGQIYYGLLRESNYFNNDNTDNQRYYGALNIEIIPLAIFPNLKLGFHKALYNYTQHFDAADLLAPISVPNTDELSNITNDSYDQLASFSVDWAFPEIGFRAYTEFAKNDFTGSFRHTILEPEHSRAYTLGFEKHTSFENGHEIQLIYEHSNLSRNHTYLWRPEPTFYVHHINRQGYTLNGQVLGAGIGPGSVNDQLNALYKFADLDIGLTLQRTEFNKDYLVTQISDKKRHNVEYSAGLHCKKSFKVIDVSADLTLSKTLNRYYVERNDVTNVYSAITAIYKIGH
ncbi:MAG: capsule assembly Wzi family protein [Cyclobacteriaceae bacterium]